MRSYRLIALACGVTLFAASLTLSAPESAASGASAIADCNAHNTLTHTYSIAQLESALRTMPADVSEYTDCKDVITRALLTQQGKLKGGGGGGSGSSGGGGSSFLPTPVIVVLVVLLLAAATLGALAIRRRRESTDGASQPPSTSS
jgi:hypothetical protein